MKTCNTCCFCGLRSHSPAVTDLSNDGGRQGAELKSSFLTKARHDDVPHLLDLYRTSLLGLNDFQKTSFYCQIVCPEPTQYRNTAPRGLSGSSSNHQFSLPSHRVGSSIVCLDHKPTSKFGLVEASQPAKTIKHAKHSYTGSQHKHRGFSAYR